MSAKFTPGPWVLTAAGEGRLERYVVCVEKDGCMESLLTNVNESGTKFAAFVKDEDAFLCAAAPDLYRVAELVIETATVETPKALIEAAEAALKKARGGK